MPVSLNPRFVGSLLLPLALIISMQGISIAQSPHGRPGFVVVDDMVLPESALRGDSGFEATPWPFGVVPYAFNANVSAANRTAVLEAMNEISAVSRVIFVPRTAHPDWIIFNANTYNLSFIGMIGGPQTIDIVSWNSKFVIVHEIMHALGFIHEQSRPDRDAFVTINYGNISTTGCPSSNCGSNGNSCVCNFDIINGATMATPYDFLSIMHYSRAAFTSNGQDTITCKPGFTQFQNNTPTNPGIGNQTFMSLGDAQGLQQRYGASLQIPSLQSISPTSASTSTSGFTLSVTGSGFFRGSPNNNGVQGTRVLWNGSPIPTTYVNPTLVTAAITPSMVSVPQTVQIGITNPLPAWGTPFSSLPLTINCQVGGLALSQGNAITVTNPCQGYSITPAYGTFNVIGITSPGSDWDIQMGTATANAGGPECDFVVGSGFDGPGTIQPLTGNVTRYSGTTSATLQHVTSTAIDVGQPAITSMPTGSIVRAYHFSAATVAGRTIHVAGPNYLRWKVLWDGNGFSWRSSTTNVIASGIVGGNPVSFGVVPSAYCLVIYSDGIPVPGAEALTISMCFDFNPTVLTGGNNITTINPGPSVCVPFTLNPGQGKWNLVGVSSASDWDLQIGGAVSQLGGNACDYVLADGHSGQITQVNGICSPYSQPASPAGLQFGFTATLPGNWNSYTSMLLAFEFLLPSQGDYTIDVQGDASYSWDLHAPGGGSGWRPASSRRGGPYPVGGGGVNIVNLYPGWHCVVVYHNGGPTGLTNPSISVGLSAVQLPTVIGVNPAIISAGSPATPLTVYGTNFTPATVARWNGIDLVTTFASATEIRATVPAVYLSTPGTSATVSAFIPTVGTSGISGTCWIVAEPPVLTSLAPLSVAPNSAPFQLTTTGRWFNSNSRIRWGSTPLATTFVNGTTLTATIPTSLIQVPGTVLVSVETPGVGTTTELSFAIANGVPSYPPRTAPGLELVQMWSATSMGIPTPLGGITFSANGSLILVGAASNMASGSLYAIPVNRNAQTQKITGLSAPFVFAPAPNIDGGLAHSNGTWFYSRQPLNAVGQFRESTGTSYSSPLPSVLQSTGGLTFVPPGLPNTGTLLVSSFGAGGISSVSTSAAGNGFLNMGAAVPFAALPPGQEGLAFIPIGPRAGDLLVANYSGSSVGIMDIDPTTGLPVGGVANPSMMTLITDWVGSEGVTCDPVTGDLFLTQYGDAIAHIAGLDSLASLTASATSVAISAGASVTLNLRAGSNAQGRPYLVGGTLSGTQPGTPAGSVTIPLNADVLTLFILQNLNSVLYQNFSGTFDTEGSATATIFIPPGLVLASPLTTDWAFIVMNPIDFASNPLRLVLQP